MALSLPCLTEAGGTSSTDCFPLLLLSLVVRVRSWGAPLHAELSPTVAGARASGLQSPSAATAPRPAAAPLHEAVCCAGRIRAAAASSSLSDSRSVVAAARREEGGGDRSAHRSARQSSAEKAIGPPGCCSHGDFGRASDGRPAPHH
eukprot:scaffold120359_cov60-Phaeocystis_antarctica.AAC.3